MSQADFWYVRFPDGRILRAASTAVLRQELDAGHIPLGSTVRRSPSDEWVSLEWSEEFAELVEELAVRTPPPRTESRRRRADKAHATANTAADRTATVDARLDPARLHRIGVRGFLDELLAALDSTFLAKKLLLGAVAGLLLGALFALERAAWFESDSRWRTMAWSLLAAGLVVFDGLIALLTRLTYIELARLHPARWSEALEGLGRLTVWVVVSQLMVGGAAGGLIVLLRWLPFWLGPAAEQPWNTSQQILAGSALAVGMLLEALLWPWFFFWWLLPPLLAVEDCTVWRGLRAGVGLAAAQPRPGVFVSDDGRRTRRAADDAVSALDRAVVPVHLPSAARTTRRGRRHALPSLGIGLRSSAGVLDHRQYLHLSESARWRQQPALTNFLFFYEIPLDPHVASGRTIAKEGGHAMRPPLWKVGELARRTGLSVRTLHWYDEIGLLTPSCHSDARHRLYTAADVARLQQIVSLRQLGFTLEEVRVCLDGVDFSPVGLIETHLARLREQMEGQRRLCERLESIAARLRVAETVSAEELLQTIEEMTMFDKYYTPEQQQWLKERRNQVGDERIRQVEAEWPQLMAQVRAEMDKGSDPASAAVQALARRWMALVHEFTGGNPGIEKSLQSMYQQEQTVAGMDVAAMRPMMAYIDKALSAARNEAK